MSVRYEIKSMEMAEDYMLHPVLRERLIECTKCVMAHPDKKLEKIFGGLDAIKFISCMTLFENVPGTDPIFSEVLQHFNEGKRCKPTLKKIGKVSKKK